LCRRYCQRRRYISQFHKQPRRGLHDHKLHYAGMAHHCTCDYKEDNATCAAFHTGGGRRPLHLHSQLLREADEPNDPGSVGSDTGVFICQPSIGGCRTAASLRATSNNENGKMKKVVMLVIMGTVLMAAVPSLWATDPAIKVQARVPAPTWLSQLLSIFH